MSDTRAFLLAHAAAYPALTLTDLFKALYQSAFGCEHLSPTPPPPKRISPPRPRARALAAIRASSRWTGRMSAFIWMC